MPLVEKARKSLVWASPQVLGQEEMKRQQLQVWELSGLLTSGTAALVARQVSDFHVREKVAFGKEGTANA